MEAKELRIGNYVELHGNIQKVTGIMERSPGLIEDYETFIYTDLQLSNTMDNEDVNPIPISAEWLIRFGFELYPWGWVKQSSKEFGVRLNITSFRYDVSGNNPVELKHIHQLQNLYFALTTEELTLQS